MLSKYNENAFLFSDRYQIVSQVWFYTKKKTYFFNVSNLRYNQFCFWPGMVEECHHKDGVYITIVSSSEKSTLHERARHIQKLLRPYFGHVGKATIFPLQHDGEAISYIIMIPSRNYLGKMPQAKQAF